MRRNSYFLGLMAGAALFALAMMAQEINTSAPRVIEMFAADYEFTPSSIHVKAGETVQIQVTANDKEHGIRIKTLSEGAAKGDAPGLEITSGQDCVKFKKHETGTITFVARMPGTYKFVCCKLCGIEHDKMKGEIVVDP
jgi:heme/copper-type cytochrome/quinol oxidase subunit 2